MPCPNTPVLEVASEVWWWKAAVRALSVRKVFRWGVICVYDIVLYYNKTDYQFLFFFFKNFTQAYRKDNDSKYANDKNCLPGIETTNAD